ncbi:hypothetical protein P171DRAFT_376537, partial [Karstenula rhodostoma CBS 690.94]
MGSFDCFCALCCGPLGEAWVKFGSKNDEALAKRRRRVEVKKRRLAGENVNESDSDEDDGMEDHRQSPLTGEGDADSAGKESDPKTKHDRNVAFPLNALEEEGGNTDDEIYNQGAGDRLSENDDAEGSEHGWEDESENDNDNQESASDAGSLGEYEEKISYDPLKLRRKDVTWLDRGRTLGFNPEALGVTKCFVSGLGQYDSYGSFRIETPDQHPTYPFHEACLQVLAKCLGLRKKGEIDRDVLYAVLSQNSKDHDPALSLDYGEIEGPEQFWESISGEEYVVSDPSYKEKLGEMIQSLIPSKLFKKNAESSNLEHKVQSDPLRKLPYNVLYEICTYLSFTDAKSFTQSSLHVYTSTQNGAFWKHMLRLHIFPWSWEVFKIMSNGIYAEDLDEKSLFLWLEAATRPRFGAEGPLMGIINRRRIWGTCQQLVTQYAEKVHPVKRAEPDEAEARAILDRAKCLHMPVVSYPIAKQCRTASVQFIRSWGEMSCRPSVLDTYWGHNGALIGISITLNGDNPRIFGSTEGTPGSPLHIPPNEWIREIVVSIDDVNMFSHEQDRSRFRNALDSVPYGTACIRSLTSGEICRLGLLQASIPGQEPSTMPSYTQAQQLLWNHSAQTLYCHRDDTWRHLWAHPNLNIQTLSAQGSSANQLRSFIGDIASDMTPWHVGIWASKGAPYQTLQQISCFQPIGGTVSSGEEEWPVPDIAGFGAGRTSGPLNLLAGTGGPVPIQNPDWQEIEDPSKDLVSWIQNTTLKSFDENSTEHFLIDGPGGEIVTAVHASSDMKAVKLFTDRGRNCYFGEKNRQQWLEFEADGDQMIVGIVCAFGRLGGWSWGTKMQSHWKLSGLAVL